MDKVKLMFGIFVSIMLALTFVSADSGDYDHGMGGMMSGSYGFGGMVFGWITGILFVAVLVLLIVWLTKQIQKK
ncbi:hypothetical protein HN903_00690 [archaeon]|jgi:hypothetical protein|nr:hypothetical protein [archaeon]MBT7128249.1 hypothetical protein [archaeon]